MADYARLAPGDPAPWFHQRGLTNPRYAFDTTGGRYLVLCFFASATDAGTDMRLRAMLARTDLFDDDRASFFGVSADPRDGTEGRLRERYPGYRYFLDDDLLISRLYGACPTDATGIDAGYRRQWLVLDPSMRLVASIAFRDDGGDVGELITMLERAPPAGQHAGREVPAPILLLPRVFEPELCRHLIELYESRGGVPSGFMREENGLTVSAMDASHKLRRDMDIEDERLIGALKARVSRRVVPEIRKAFQFTATRMERYIVACYSTEHGGHFRPHRDNTTHGTAHRRFALSVNLNEDYDGCEIGFPEYGPRTYRTETGGAVVFSCSILHMVHPIRRGRRYVFLPFLYDDAAAVQRERNNPYLAEGIGAYRSDHTGNDGG
ncbi:MAG: 2OG-Fe(II) oxygenase [Pseudomonadales bacterium]|nr:2OG-Fe(II) oxygenase [Pseudomonadales bacterium]MCP5185449.1 2OG-Fe(II) oxygenase [Pseudomonadales bacterium]